MPDGRVITGVVARHLEAALAAHDARPLTDADGTKWTGLTRDQVIATLEARLGERNRELNAARAAVEELEAELWTMTDELEGDA